MWGGDALESTKHGAGQTPLLEESSRCFRLPELWEVIYRNERGIVRTSARLHRDQLRYSNVLLPSSASSSLPCSDYLFKLLLIGDSGTKHSSPNLLSAHLLPIVTCRLF